MESRKITVSKQKLIDKIHDDVYWAVNDIIIIYQDKFGIEDGDVDPLVAHEADQYFDEAVELLDKYVERILVHQAYWYGCDAIFK